MGTYEVQTRAATQKFHDDPQLDAPHKTRLVLCDKRTGASAQNGDFLLDFFDVIVAAFEINLECGQVGFGCAKSGGDGRV